MHKSHIFHDPSVLHRNAKKGVQIMNAVSLATKIIISA